MANSGGILDAINYCRNKFSSIEDQGNWVKNGLMQIMLRDHSDIIRSMQARWNGYDILLRMWPDGGQVFFYYELYKGGGYVGNGIEMTKGQEMDIQNTSLEFSSTSVVNRPIISEIVNQN